jgi:hypothetical protein
MFKVKYEGYFRTVYDVKIERFVWGNYGENNEPSNTWFLIGVDGYFKWVQAFECEPVEE